MHKRPKIVIVEDDELLALVLAYNLVNAGYAVDSVDCGSKALATIDQARPDAVLLDWELPELSGIEVLRRLRRSEALQNLPVIMLTARSSTDDCARALAVGANRFMAKPFGIRMLIQELADLLSPGIK